MSTEKKFINGIFITEWDGRYGPYLSIGITDKFIEEIVKIPKNERGVRNFIAARQNKDKSRFSAFLPEKKGSSAPRRDSVDDLPF